MLVGTTFLISIVMLRLAIFCAVHFPVICHQTDRMPQIIFWVSRQKPLNYELPHQSPFSSSINYCFSLGNAKPGCIGANRLLINELNSPNWIENCNSAPVSRSDQHKCCHNGGQYLFKISRLGFGDPRCNLTNLSTTGPYEFLLSLSHRIPEPDQQIIQLNWPFYTGRPYGTSTGWL